MRENKQIADLKHTIDIERKKIDRLETCVERLTIERNNWKYKAQSYEKPITIVHCLPDPPKNNPPRLMKESGIACSNLPGNKQDDQVDWFRFLLILLLIGLLFVNVLVFIQLDSLLTFLWKNI